VNGVSLPIPALRFRGFRVLQSISARKPRMVMASIHPVRPQAHPGPSGLRFRTPLKTFLFSGCSSPALRRHRSVFASALPPWDLRLTSTIEAESQSASLERRYPSAYPEESAPFFVP
jgi:hypothetical protein